MDSSLSLFVQKRFEELYHLPVTSGELARVGDPSQYRISRATAHKVLRDPYPNPAGKTISYLARVLQVKKSEILRHLGQSVQDLPDFELPVRAHQLSRKERQVVVSVIDAILEHGKETFIEHHSTPDLHPGLKAVARKPRPTSEPR